MTGGAVYGCDGWTDDGGAVYGCKRCSDMMLRAVSSA